MFPFLSLPTARRIFVLACLLPTLVVIGWATAKSLPGKSSRVSQALSQDLRLIANVTDFSTPKPGQLAYERLQLLQPVTQEELVRLESLTVSQRAGVHYLNSPKVDVHVHALPHLAHWFQMYVFDAVSRRAGNYQITIDSVHLHHGEQIWLVGCLSGTVSVATDRSEFHLEFRPSQADSTRSHLQLHGDFTHTGTQPSGTIDVTIDHPKPAVWLSAMVPNLNLGAEAQWIGALHWHAQYGQPWSTDLQGRLSQVALDHISNGAVSGSASIDIAKCRIQAGNIEELSATVHSPEGEINLNWLQVLLDPLSHQIDPSPPAVGRYSSLAAGIAYVPDEAAWFLSPVASADPNEKAFLPILRHALDEKIWVSFKEPRMLPPLPTTH